MHLSLLVRVGKREKARVIGKRGILLVSVMGEYQHQLVSIIPLILLLLTLLLDIDHILGKKVKFYVSTMVSAIENSIGGDVYYKQDSLFPISINNVCI